MSTSLVPQDEYTIFPWCHLTRYFIAGDPPGIYQLGDAPSKIFVSHFLPQVEEVITLRPVRDAPHPGGGLWNVSRIENFYDLRNELLDFMRSLRGRARVEWDRFTRWFVLCLLAEMKLLLTTLYASYAQAVHALGRTSPMKEEGCYVNTLYAS